MESSLFQQLGIDRTQLRIADEIEPDRGLLFASWEIAEMACIGAIVPSAGWQNWCWKLTPTAQFILHTGDVVYLVGSSEQYPKILFALSELLAGSDRVCYDTMVFNRPFLAVPGKHDYYDLPIAFGVLSQLLRPLRQAFRYYIDLDVGLHGSYSGDAYARAF